jgi:hypothetical protein
MSARSYLVRIVQAEVCGPHSLRLRFQDGLTGQVDLLAYLVGPVFEPLREPGYFSTGILDSVTGTVVWPNDADFAPEFLHALVRAETATG